ncbi:non-ribosomal peptide synthetase, partial [Thermoflavimicrobium dichotomicum]
MFNRKNIKNMYRLSPMQRGMLFHYLKNPTSETYFEQIDFQIEGTVHPSYLEESWNRLIEKYDLLRTVFLYKKIKEPTQIVLKERTATIHFEDLSHLEKENCRQYIEAFKKKDRKTGFQLSRDLLMRLALFKTGANTYQLIVSFHHILMDGWCLGIVLHDLFEIYRCLLNNQPVPQEAVIPYSKYIEWLEEQDEEEAKAYWRAYLQGYEQVSGLPFPAFANSETANEHEVLTYEFTSHLTSQLTKLAKSYQVTLNTVFQTIWGVLLQKYNQTNDVVFGSVISGRSAEIPGIERMVGLFINTIPVRIQSLEGETFADLLTKVKQSALSSEQYGYLSLADIQAEGVKNQTLFNHILVFENYPDYTDAHQHNQETLGFTVVDREVFSQTNYDLSVQAYLRNEKLHLILTFNGRVYPRVWMEKVFTHFHEIVMDVIERPDIPLAEIDIVPEAEKCQLLEEFNNTDADYPRDKTIHALFEEQVEKHPDRVALVFQGQTMTYRELNARANQLAHALRKKGVQRDQIIGLIADRSMEMIVGILGILKSGGAYMPIDPTYPGERIRYMLEDSQAKLLVVQRAEMIPADYKGEILFLGEGFEELASNPEPINQAQDLAYVIYTSGSTGKPKGNLTTHQNVVKTIINNGYVEIEEEDRILNLSNYAFDGSTYEIYSALLHGARLVLIPREVVLNTAELARVIREEQITSTFMTASLFNTLVELDVSCLKSMRKLLFGGEKASVKHVQKALEVLGEHCLINGYGPTETTVFAATYSVDHRVMETDMVPIGRPIHNTRIYIVNQHNQLQPIGVPGELCVSGEGLARGYLNRPELTAERFVENPFVPGERMYRTGDLARWLPDGNIEYMGRMDEQVKIRGFRIELGEIEAKLLEHPVVREAVLLARRDEQGHSYLCAYLVTDGPWTVAEMREHLGQSLPEYMIPSYFVGLEKLPLTTNGKVDKRALPEPRADLMSEGYVAPTNATEESLVQIWKDVLKVEQ